MPYIAYLPYIPNIPYFPNMPYQTDHTHHTYPTYHTTLPPHHRGGEGQFHPPTTPQGGRGKISHGGSIWDPSNGGGWQGLVHFLYTILFSLYIYILHHYCISISTDQKWGAPQVRTPSAAAGRKRKPHCETCQGPGLGWKDGTLGSCEKNPEELMYPGEEAKKLINEW